MASALDRVKAAEAKYTALVATAEKLEATLKELKSTAKTCQWSIDELHRVVKKARRCSAAVFSRSVSAEFTRLHVWPVSISETITCKS